MKALFQLPPSWRRGLAWFTGILMALGLVIALVPSDYIETGFEISDKIQHLVAFFGFALLIDMASTRSFWRFQVPLLLAYGALVEILQAFTPWRFFSVADFAADVAGVLLYWLLFRALLQIKPVLSHDSSR